MMKIEDVMLKFQYLIQGDKILYHIGNLAHARERNKEIDMLATQAWSLYKANKVELIQEKANNTFYYFAKVRKKKQQFMKAFTR